MSEFKVFPLNTREDIVRFERCFLSYFENHGGYAIQHISLLRTYDALQNTPDGGRIFSAILDISINLGLIWCDTAEMGRCINQVIQVDFADLSESEATQKSFELRMKLHHYSNAYIFRYRSLWDKIMGLFVLVLAPTEYEKFCSANSKKRFFAKIARNGAMLSYEIVEQIQSAIQKFDDMFRTAEAHGTGFLRKSSFVWTELETMDQLKLIDYWNLLNQIAHIIGELFDHHKRIIDEN